jgi:glycosyltransferase involved in cell wall biosynthesis
LGDRLGVSRRTEAISAPDDETLARVYAASDVLAQPSLGEGFGIPVIEAMACGLPVVISDGGALPEVAGGAARVVSLAERDFSGALAQELARAAGQRAELAASGVARAAVFRPAVVVDALLEAYQQALQRSASRR